MTVGVTSLCFVGGFVLCVAAAVCPALVPMLAGLVRPLISYLLWSANIIADLGFGTLSPEQHLRSGGARHRVRGVARVLTVGKHVKWKAVLPCLAVVLIGFVYCRGASPERPVYGDVSAVRQRSGHSAERHRTRDAHRLRWQLPERCASGTRVAALEWSEAAGYGRADRGRSGTCAQTCRS